jgi:uncharacterized membrane protein (DUF485 family)
MARSLLESLGLFASPFLLYALFLIFRARHPLLVASWSRGAVSWLILGGLGLVIASFVVAGLTSGRQSGTYIPAHIENGTLAPGRFQ